MQTPIADLTNLTLDEVLQTDAQNRAWSRDLRTQSSHLVNRRLAAQISLEEYVASRKHVNEEIAECKRRGQVLSTEIEVRNHRFRTSVQFGR